MAKRVIQMYDKYKSTTKTYPKVIKECLQKDVTDYIEGQVEANPTLAGTEASLTGLQIGETKYKVGGGKQLYQHNITISNKNSTQWIFRLTIINDTITPIDTTTLRLWLTAKGFDASESTPHYYKANGIYSVGATVCNVVGIANNSGSGNDIWLQGVSLDGTTKKSGALGGQYNLEDVPFEI